MIRSKWWGAPLILSGCSLLIDVDGDDYVRRPVIDGDGDGDGDGDSDGGTAGRLVEDDNGPGGFSGSPDGGTESGGSDGDGGETADGGSSSGGMESGGSGGLETGGSGGGSGGLPTGGSIQAPLHHYALDEGSGSSVADSGYSPLTGMASDSSSWAPSAGVDGGSYEFEGTNYLEFDPQVAAVAPFSLSFWMNPTEGAYRIIVDKLGEGVAEGFQILQENKAMQLRTGARNNPATFNQYMGNIIEVLGDPSIPRWYHLALTYCENVDNGPQDRLRLYVDGQLVIEGLENFSDMTPENDSTTLRFGFRSNAMHPIFNGLIDDIRVFAWELSSEEVESLHDQSAP